MEYMYVQMTVQSDTPQYMNLVCHLGHNISSAYNSCFFFHFIWQETLKTTVLN